MEFNVSVKDPCPAAVLYPGTVANGVYSVGSATSSFIFSEWTVSNSFCGPVSYNVTSNKGTLPIATPSITFNPTLRSIDFFTQDYAYALQEY